MTILIISIVSATYFILGALVFFKGMKCQEKQNDKACEICKFNNEMKYNYTDTPKDADPKKKTPVIDINWDEDSP